MLINTTTVSSQTLQHRQLDLNMQDIQYFKFKKYPGKGVYRAYNNVQKKEHSTFQPK